MPEIKANIHKMIFKEKHKHCVVTQQNETKKRKETNLSSHILAINNTRVSNGNHNNVYYYNEIDKK